jgi:hypothetical protein
LQKGVVEEQADGLRLLIVVGACGALITRLGDLPQIMVAHLYRQFAEPAAPRSRSVRIRSADVAIVVSLHRGNVHAKPFPRRERRKGARGAGLPSAAASRDGSCKICRHAFRRTGAPGPASRPVPGGSITREADGLPEAAARFVRRPCRGPSRVPGRRL